MAFAIKSARSMASSSTPNPSALTPDLTCCATFETSRIGTSSTVYTAKPAVIRHHNYQEWAMTTFQVEVRALECNPDPLRVFRSEFLASPRHFFLESSVVKPGFSRFSFMGDSHGRWAETITYDKSSRSACIERSDGVTREA